jgi:long-subunit acyl-CoA synthetase (AMP-forming)
LQKGYGLTETTAGFCRSISAEESQRIGSVGRLSWGAEAKIIDPETGAALPPGVPGELFVRGPFVMKGTARQTYLILTSKDDDYCNAIIM